jgi:hypothetical protein
VIGDALVLLDEGEELCDPATLTHFAGILFKMQHDVPADCMERAFQALSNEAQYAVNEIMKQYTQSKNVVTP